MSRIQRTATSDSLMKAIFETIRDTPDSTSDEIVAILSLESDAGVSSLLTDLYTANLVSRVKKKKPGALRTKYHYRTNVAEFRWGEQERTAVRLHHEKHMREETRREKGLEHVPTKPAVRFAAPKTIQSIQQTLKEQVELLKQREIERQAEKEQAAPTPGYMTMPLTGASWLDDDVKVAQFLLDLNVRQLLRMRRVLTGMMDGGARKEAA